jgi:hypothetical protein
MDTSPAAADIDIPMMMMMTAGFYNKPARLPVLTSYL